MGAAEIEGLQKRLDVIIALLLQGLERDGVVLSAKNQIAVLADLGLRPAEIAKVLGRSQKYINKELVSIRRKKGKS